MKLSTLSSALLSTLATAALCAAEPATSTKPNIIFILCDDLGYGDVGVFYQNQRAALKDRSVPFFSTPNIDSLAHDGVQLTHHYCAAPVCAPSRASFLSGLNQGHAEVRDNQFDKALADSFTVANVLQQAGYATAAIGKWGLQGRDKKAPKAETDESAGGEKTNGVIPAGWSSYPTKRGFSDYFGYVRHVDGHFHYPKEDKVELWDNEREVSADFDLCYTADLFTARAKKWITEQTAAKPAQPFFIYLAYDTPHAKLQNPPCAYPEGGGLRGGVQWTGKPHAMLNTATGTVDGYMFPDYANATWDNDRNPSTPEVPWPDVQRRFANDVRRIDFCVGDLLQLLKDLHLDDNTMIVFTSDNGPSQESKLPEAYEPNFFRGFGPFDGIKRDTWEGGIREPTLARWPGVIPPGRISDHPAGQWNWLNTFADAAGLPALAASDGVSLLPSLTGRGSQMANSVYIEYSINSKTPDYPEFSSAHRKRTRGQMQVIELDGYHGIRYDIHSADDNFEIYDVAKDPQQLNNLAKNPEFSALQTKMKARVLQVRMPDTTAKRPYDQALVPGVTEPTAATPGLSWALFTGTYPWVPDFRTLTPTTTGQSAQIDLSPIPQGHEGGIAFTGFFQAKKDGAYTFSLTCAAGATMFLHDIRVITEQLHHDGSASQGTVQLKAGWHPLRLYSRHLSNAAPTLTLTCKLNKSENYPLTDVWRTTAGR